MEWSTFKYLERFCFLCFLSFVICKIHTNETISFPYSLKYNGSQLLFRFHAICSYFVIQITTWQQIHASKSHCNQLGKKKHYILIPALKCRRIMLRSPLASAREKMQCPPAPRLKYAICKQPLRNKLFITLIILVCQILPYFKRACVLCVQGKI